MQSIYWIKRKASILRLLRTLRAHDCIKSVKLRTNYIKVVFKDGIIEYWYIRKPAKVPIRGRSFVLPKSNQFFKFDIRTFCEYETKPFEDERNKALKPFFIVQAKDISRAGFADVRIKVHRLVDELLNEGWLDPKYPPEVLRKELAKIKTVPLVDSLLGNSPWQHYGFYNITHFMPVAKYRVNGAFEEFNLTMLWRRSLLYRTINRLVRTGRSITRVLIIKRITKILSYKYLKIVGPLFHRYVFDKYWPINGKSVLDLIPAWGAKALAIVACGGTYYHMPNYIFDKSLAQMTEFAGRKSVVDDGQRKYDLVIVNDFRTTNFEQLLAKTKVIQPRATNMMVFFSKKDNKKIFANFKPKLMLDLRIREKYVAII